MKESIKERARQLGFDACRVTSADPPPSSPHFLRWLDSGQHGQMAYLARNAQKRIEPNRVLSGAKSVLNLAASYATLSSFALGAGKAGSSQIESAVPRSKDAKAKEGTSPVGLVARYACHADYHDVLAGPLKQLGAFVDELGGQGTRSLWYVDTGPLLERDLAQRAGLGFVGKHTNLISRQLGNWFFLAEIITTLELPPDDAERNHCGSCTRCISACPTGAITGPFQLDARRCISYLTIELKGSIPVELRPAIGHRIFGCDDCLEVCPWNRFAREGGLMKRHAQGHLQNPDLIELLSLDDAGFHRRFAGTPLLRTKRRGLLRNAAVALGNVGDASALPVLATAAQDPEPIIAEHACWAIHRIESRCRSGA